METIGKRRGETKGVSSNEKRIKFEKGFEKNCSNSARDITTKTSTPFVFPYIILQIVFPYIILQIVCVSIIELYRTCDSALYTLTLFFF